MFELSDAYSPGGLEEVITALVNELIVITRPKFTSYFPLDLDTANEILQGLVTVLDERISTSIHTVLTYYMSLAWNMAGYFTSHK